MVKYVLDANADEVIELEGLNRPQYLIFQDISATTKIKVDIQKVGVDDVKIIPLMRISTVHEAQQKIQKLLNGVGVVPTYDTGIVQMHSMVQLSVDGEVALGSNEKIIITLSDKGANGGNMFVKGGTKQVEQFYKLSAQNYDGKNDESRIDVSKFDYLVFDNVPTSVPQLIERFYDNEVKRDSSEDLKLTEVMDYGVVSYVADIPVFGQSSAIVVNVIGLTTLLLKDDRGDDFKYFGVKLPFNVNV